MMGEEDEDETWVHQQARFWYGENLNRILDDDRRPIEDGWVEISEILRRKSDYGRRVKEPLSVFDTTEEAVALKYGTFGTYRFEENVRVLKDWIAHDASGSMTPDKRYPIFMVDCIGPGTPLIGYNRVVSDPCAVLWPLKYHHDLAAKGLADVEPFAEKKNRQVVFRGALSGPLVTDTKRNKTSRVDVVCRWKGRSWADMGLSSVPEHVKDHRDYAQHERRIEEAMSDNMPMDALMKYKYVLCVEGADVSSGFGWALASNCLPIHPYPFCYEVWFFNGLRPWVHFVPIQVDGGGLDEAYEWCERNPEKCAIIAANGRSHMSKMLDERSISAVKKEVVARWKMRTFTE